VTKYSNREATSSLRLDSDSGTPQHILIGLYLFNHIVNPNIKSNNQIKTTKWTSNCGKKYKTRT